MTHITAYSFLVIVIRHRVYCNNSEDREFYNLENKYKMPTDNRICISTTVTS